MDGLKHKEELERFYSKSFNFSYSSINKLLFSPTLFFRHYILNEKEDSVDAHLVYGRVLHCLLLDEDKFNEQFIILPGKFPSDNIKTVVDNVFSKHYLFIGNESLSLKDFPQEILNELLTINLYQSLKTDIQRLEKVVNDQTEAYFEFLKDKQDKTVVDSITYSSAKEAADLIKQNETISSLMNLNNDAEEHIETYNEIKLSSTLENSSFGIKGILDNVIIDRKRKIIFINDLKTTGKPIQDFQDSIDYYNYWIQAVIYFFLVVNEYLSKEDNVDDWNVNFTFVVIDKYNCIYPFQVSDETFLNWVNKFYKEILPKLKYHYDGKQYQLPYELALGTVKL